MFGKYSLRCIILCIVTGCVIVGCSGEEALPLTNISMAGKILYRGKPVPFALVIVIPGDQSGGISATSNADSEGNYRVDAIPRGNVKIAVNSDAGMGAYMNATMGSARKGEKTKLTFVDVPKKYHDPQTSGLTLDVQQDQGVISHDIILE